MGFAWINDISISRSVQSSYGALLNLSNGRSSESGEEIGMSETTSVSIEHTISKTDTVTVYSKPKSCTNVKFLIKTMVGTLDCKNQI